MFDKDWVDAYFENGVDVANRRVFLDSEITDVSIGSAVRGLYLMETESDEQPVEMFISSYGGDLQETLALYDHPQDSFAKAIGLPTALEKGLIVPIEGEKVDWLPKMRFVIPSMIRDNNTPLQC